MNWEQINKKYPNAINKFFDWLDIDSEEEITAQYESLKDGHKEFYPQTRLKIFEMDNLIFWNDRQLYDFFDEQGIYIFPLRGGYHFKGLKFGYEIQADRRYRQHGFKSRPQAEQAAFEKAFEILENNLK